MSAASNRAFLAKAALALLASASPLAITPALAEGVAPQAGAAQPNTDSVGEIVVTATKRSETLQNVPLAITAMTSEQLSQHHVASFDDYAKMLPSVSYQSFGPGQTQLNFRGITSGGDGLAIGPLPTAGLYIDETPVTTIYGAVDLHIYDMERVEALSGPQGTLYGASSLAGTLRLITAKPKLGKWEGGIDVEGNKFGPGGAGGKIEGFLNVPISANAALRVVAFYQHDGGYISNSPATRTYQRGNGVDEGGNPITSPITVNNAAFVKKNFNTVDQFGGRAALKVDLDDNWTATPTVIYQHQIAKGTYLFNDPANPNYSAGYVPGYGKMQVHDFTPDHNRDAWVLASLTVQGKLSDWDITYSGSYFNRKADTIADYSYFTAVYDNLTASPATAGSYAGYTTFTDQLGKPIDPTQIFHQHDSYTKTSHELRISSPADKPFKLTAGLFLQRQKNEHIADYVVPGMSTSQEVAGWQIPGAPVNDVYYTDATRTDRDYAMFAEGTWDITPQITLIAGIRGFMADNSLNGTSGGLGSLNKVASVNGCVNPTVTTCPNIDKNYQEAGETHKAEIKWTPARGKMVYFLYSTGFRPGGNNRDSYFNGRVQRLPPFQADRLTNFEIGWKLSLLDRKLYFDGALFIEKWNKMQYSQPGIQGIFYTLNAGRSKSKGVEASLNWKPVHGLTLSGNGTYIDAKLGSDFICGVADGCGSSPFGTVFAAKGTQLPITPKFKFNATARYEWEMASGLKAFVQGGVTHQSSTRSYLTDAGATALGPTFDFTTADFSAGVSKDQWTLTAFITNAFDERGILSKNAVCAPNASLCGPVARLYPTKPQEFGLRAGYRF